MPKPCADSERQKAVDGDSTSAETFNVHARQDGRGSAISCEWPSCVTVKGQARSRLEYSTDGGQLIRGDGRARRLLGGLH